MKRADTHKHTYTFTEMINAEYDLIKPSRNHEIHFLFVISEIRKGKSKMPKAPHRNPFISIAMFICQNIVSNDVIIKFIIISIKIDFNLIDN